jgi:molybdenum cofactor biosynthesis protein B
MPPAPECSASPSGEHRAAGPASVRCAVITISDTRGEAEDKSGRHIRDSLAGAGHEVAFYRIVKDEPEQIRAAIEAALAADGVRAILLNGGTGIGSRDLTHETISAMLEKRLDGFGEIFRVLSYQEVGAAAMLSRAVAGVYKGAIVFSMPGSTNAVRLAMEKLILPELGHVLRELNR